MRERLLVIGELFSFVLKLRLWWMLPLLLGLLLVAVLAAVAATPAGPFIYSVF